MFAAAERGPRGATTLSAPVATGTAFAHPCAAQPAETRRIGNRERMEKQVTNLLNPPLALNSVVQRAGFFGKRHTLGDLADGRELERRIGYQPGTMSMGWYVLYMVARTPGPTDFEFGGYSHFSGGYEQGHKTPRGEHVENWLHNHSVSILKSRENTASNFTLQGPQRLAKIYPLLKCSNFWHPDPNPIPQWKLTSPMEFHVTAFYNGYSSAAEAA